MTERTPLGSPAIGTSTTDLIGRMLLRQARRRRAPDWVHRALAGGAEAATVREEGDTRLVIEGQEGGRVEIDVRLRLPAAPVGRGPWRPRGVGLPRKSEELERLSYVVVDEIVEGMADVSVSPWPAVDDRGRLLFPDEPPRSVQADVAALLEYLRGIDFRPGDPPQELRMGAAFAAQVRREGLEPAGRRRRPPRAWLVAPVYDLRSAARDKAKQAFYAAVAPTLAPEDAERLRNKDART